MASLSKPSRRHISFHRWTATDPFEEQLVAEEIREAGRGGVIAVEEDAFGREDLAAVADDGTGRDAVDIPVRVEMDLVSVAQERGEGHPLHRGEARPDPEGLD